MSTGRKGTSIERLAKEQLLEEGFVVHRTVRTPIYQGGRVVGSHNNDVFGVFDLIASRAERVRFIQVTTSDNLAARQGKVETLAAHFPGGVVSVEVWGWVGGRRQLDRRYRQQKVFRRRQYFRTVRWSPRRSTWVDVTPEQAGWPDGAPPWLEDRAAS